MSPAAVPYNRPRMTPILEIRAARRSFGATRALDCVDLDLRRGEWLALLGPNGAGKTTLIRAIAGRVRLDAGEVTILGERAVPERSTVRRRLGVVPQEIALYPLLTARENLEIFAALHGVRGAERRERVRWALEWTGLGDRSREPIKRFSGGMKRRLNIACGVLHQPEIVLLDEPTVGVDPQSRQRIWEMLGSLRSAGASLLLTTHQLDEAQQVADRIAILDHGRVVASGTFDDLLRATVGVRRQVRVMLAGGRVVRDSVESVAIELPPLLARVAADGAAIEDVSVDAPTLQSVFIHLTGRELRE
jgi:ABC-2 type transport system ATP-binding protein